MRVVVLLLTAMLIVGCQKDDMSQSPIVSSVGSAKHTFEQVHKEESESHVVLGLESQIFKKYLKLAEAGDANAQARVSAVYANETQYADLRLPIELLKNVNLTDRDKTIASDKDSLFQESDMWMSRAAENGHSYSQYQQGFRYATGLRVKKDPTVAIQWYEQAAFNGFPDALIELGHIYREGKMVARDCEKALGYYSRLQSLEEKEKPVLRAGRYYLNALFEDKACAPHLPRDALAWYDRGAALSVASALNNVGLIYEYGQGVSRDMSMAARFYEGAANRGYTVAQYNVGLCYAKGLGVIKDQKQAYFWMLLASAKEDHDAIRMRDRLERLLSTEERNQAQSDAKNWKPT